MFPRLGLCLLVCLAACKSPAPQEVRPEAPAPAVADRAPIAAADAQALLDRWLQAQNTSNLAAYSELYATDFFGTKRSGKRTKQFDRAGWLQDRKPNFSKPLTVAASEVEIKTTPDSAEIRFVQDWASSSFRDVGQKVLFLRPENGSLKITKEEMLDLVAREGWEVIDFAYYNPKLKRWKYTQAKRSAIPQLPIAFTGEDEAKLWGQMYEKTPNNYISAKDITPNTSNGDFSFCGCDRLTCLANAATSGHFCLYCGCRMFAWCLLEPGTFGVCRKCYFRQVKNDKSNYNIYKPPPKSAGTNNAILKQPLQITQAGDALQMAKKLRPSIDVTEVNANPVKHTASAVVRNALAKEIQSTMPATDIPSTVSSVLSSSTTQRRSTSQVKSIIAAAKRTIEKSFDIPIANDDDNDDNDNDEDDTVDEEVPDDENEDSDNDFMDTGSNAHPPKRKNKENNFNVVATTGIVEFDLNYGVIIPPKLKKPFEVDEIAHLADQSQKFIVSNLWYLACNLVYDSVAKDDRDRKPNKQAAINNKKKSNTVGVDMTRTDR